MATVTNVSIVMPTAANANVVMPPLPRADFSLDDNDALGVIIMFSS
jgi:hypothetical protein